MGQYTHYSQASLDPIYIQPYYKYRAELYLPGRACEISRVAREGRQAVRAGQVTGEGTVIGGLVCTITTPGYDPE